MEHTRLPAKFTAGDHSLQAIEIRRMYFLEQLRAIVDCPEPKAHALYRAADQVRGVLHPDDDTVALSVETLRGMNFRETKAIIQASMAFGDAGKHGTPKVTEGDGISKPFIVDLVSPCDELGGRLYIKAHTLADLERLAGYGDSMSQIQGLLDVAGVEHPEKLAPADGWFLFNTHMKVLQGKARKVLEGVRSYEIELRFPLNPEMTIAQVIERQQSYGSVFEKKSKAIKAAQAKNKTSKRRK